MTPFSYTRAFRTFFRIGFFTIGGGPAMIPFIERETVEHYGWLQEEEFLDLMAIAQSAPGVFVANFAIAIGYRLGGRRGSVVCTTATVLPSIICILAIAMVFRQFQDNAVVQNVFRGIRPAVAALILGPVFRLSKSAGINWKNVWLPVTAALLIWLLGVNPVWVIVAGIVGGTARWWLSQRKGAAGRQKGGER